MSPWRSSAVVECDVVQGKGLGSTLEPASLYEDQLARRTARETVGVERAPSAPSAARGVVRFVGDGIRLGDHRVDGTRAAP